MENPVIKYGLNSSSPELQGQMFESYNRTGMLNREKHDIGNGLTLNIYTIMDGTPILGFDISGMHFSFDQVLPNRYQQVLEQIKQYAKSRSV